MRCTHIASVDNKEADLLSRWSSCNDVATRFLNIVGDNSLQEFKVNDSMFDFIYCV